MTYIQVNIWYYKLSQTGNIKVSENCLNKVAVNLTEEWILGKGGERWRPINNSWHLASGKRNKNKKRQAIFLSQWKQCKNFHPIKIKCVYYSNYCKSGWQVNSELNHVLYTYIYLNCAIASKISNYEKKNFFTS